MSNFFKSIIAKVSKGGDSIFKRQRTGEAMEPVSDDHLDASVMRASTGNITRAVHSLGWLRQERSFCVVAVIDQPLDQHDAELLSDLEGEAIGDMPEDFVVSWVLVPLSSLGEPWDRYRILYRRGDPMSPPYDFREEAPDEEARFLPESEISDAIKKVGRKYVRNAVHSLGWVRTLNGIQVGVMIDQPMVEDEIYPPLYSLEEDVIAELGGSIQVSPVIVPLPTEERLWKDCEVVLRRSDPGIIDARPKEEPTPVQKGQPGYKERVDFGEIIGDYVDHNGRATPTTKGTILYGRNGAHIIPSRP